MAISGAWATRARSDYTGATKWGNGYNPIHEVRDNGRGRVVGAKETLLPLGEPSDVIAPDYLATDDWLCEPYADQTTEGESFRYQDDRPRFDQTTPQFRDATNSPAMGETPAWGVYYDANPDGDFPRPGPTGGTQEWLDVSHGELQERQHAIAVPTQPVTGGWMSKVRGAQAQPESQDPTQPGFVFTINNATVQGPGLKSSTNDRATARGTDSARSAITSRTAGQVEKVYGRSFGMGGGAGTPRMDQQEQMAGYRRPWFPRTAATPPLEDHLYNEMEGRVPINRTMPADPYLGDPEADGVGEDDAYGWGY